MFFETLDSELIPISRIERVSEFESEGRIQRWMVDLIDGDQVFIGKTARNSLEHLSMASFPAPAGTEVLRVSEGRLHSYPVIGWIVPSDGRPLPITVDGVNDGQEPGDYLPVLMSDGFVYHPEDAVLSIEEFKRSKGVTDGVIVVDPKTPGFADLLGTVQPQDVHST